MFDESYDLNLTKTLRLALEQSEQQKKLFDNRTQTILELQCQVKSLKDELKAAQNDGPEGELNKQKIQIESLLKENAEKQFEIDNLRKTLQMLKAKVRSRGAEGLLSSSPVSANASGKTKENIVSPASIALGRAPDEFDDLSDSVAIACTTKDAIDSSPVRKRLKSGHFSNPQAPFVKSGRGKTLEVKVLGSSGIKSPQQTSEEDVIAAIAEDGDHLQWAAKRKAGDQRIVCRPATYDRLSQLMSRPLSAACPLSRPSATQPRTQILHGSGESDTDLGQSLLPDMLSQAPPPRSNILVANDHLAPEQDPRQPLRSRRIHELNLAHFKLNPAFIDHPDVTSDRSQWKYSHLDRSTYVQHSNQAAEEGDDVVLMRFLGPGSEERIRHLTASARQNLLHEARTSLMSDVYGNKHMQNTRKQSPSGFWSTDMPGSQEEEINRENGRLKEADEVRQRYRVAINGGGRWLFADE